MRLFLPGENRYFELSSGCRLEVGRQEGCAIRLQDKRVSRRHAEITEENGKIFVQDLGSHAGTWKNGARIEGRTELAAGDELKIGDFLFLLEGGEEKGSSSPSPAKEAAPVKEAESETRHSLPLYEEQAEQQKLFTESMMVLSKKVQNRVLEILNVGKDTQSSLSSSSMRPQAESALDQVLREIRHEIPDEVNMAMLRQTLLDNLIGLGPLSPLLRDNSISEIMVNGPDNVFIERKGLQYRAASRFQGEMHLQSIIQRIVEPLGRHIDAASPMVDARLEDGSRVNAVIPPLALDGSLLTIRKFSSKRLTTDDLEKFGSLTHPMSLFLKEAVRARRNILVSGGTGSGKTTLLNILSQFIPEKERVITVEDSAELKLTHENLCRLEARPANVEGQGRVTIRDLVINTLRMRPDRIIVGECRGAEALDMLQAMNTGHDGSMTTCHANNPRDALSRLENMVMMAGFELPSSAIREQIASAIHLIVQQTRLPDGSRKIVKISEVTGRESGMILMQDIFTFEQEGFDEKFHVVGHHTATGNIPRFIDELRQAGDLKLDMSVFVPEG
jgi:pilus assembly protein CpaF